MKNSHNNRSAVGYAREITETQDHSIEEQKKHMLRYASGHGFKFVRLYEDSVIDAPDSEDLTQKRE